MKPLCAFSDSKYNSWYWYLNYSVLGAFAIIWGVLFAKILQSKPGNERVPSLTAFHIVSMGTIATLLAVIGWGGTCIDVLG